jgi:hypothetical protein
MSRYPALGEQLGHLSGLAALLTRAQFLAGMDQRLRALLPPELAQVCRLANCRDGELVFLASSAPWASKLRLKSRSLLAEATRASGQQYSRLTVKIARS